MLEGHWERNYLWRLRKVRQRYLNLHSFLRNISSKISHNSLTKVETTITLIIHNLNNTSLINNSRSTSKGSKAFLLSRTLLKNKTLSPLIRINIALNSNIINLHNSSSIKVLAQFNRWIKPALFPSYIWITACHKLNLIKWTIEPVQMELHLAIHHHLEAAIICLNFPFISSRRLCMEVSNFSNRIR
jgi:hypothetical protein